jgi:hypothetical protein
MDVQQTSIKSKTGLMEKRTTFHGHTRRPIGTPVPHDSQSPAQRIFLLSPANASGIRGTRLLMK